MVPDRSALPGQLSAPAGEGEGEGNIILHASKQTLLHFHRLIEKYVYPKIRAWINEWLNYQA